MRCIEPEEIATVLGLPPDDSRRRHLEECPRCASRLLLYQRFLSAAEAPGADSEGADLKLEAAMREAIYGAAASAEPAPPSLARRRSRANAWRPVWAAAAALIVIAAALWWRPWSPDRTMLRSGEEGTGVRAVRLLEPERLDHGAIRLSWRSLNGADGYVIRIRDLDLEEIARFGPLPDTTFVLQRSMLPPGTGSPVLWRVIALRSGDEIGRSGPASLELDAPPSE